MGERLVNSLREVIHELDTLRFGNFRLPFSTVETHTLPPSPSPSKSLRILNFKEGMTEIYFVNYYQSKNH